eukprot:444833-Rhodomonas_salina.2
MIPWTDGVKLTQTNKSKSKKHPLALLASVRRCCRAGTGATLHRRRRILLSTGSRDAWPERLSSSPQSSIAPSEPSRLLRSDRPARHKGGAATCPVLTNVVMPPGRKVGEASWVRMGMGGALWKDGGHFQVSPAPIRRRRKTDTRKHLLSTVCSRNADACV